MMNEFKLEEPNPIPYDETHFKILELKKELKEKNEEIEKLKYVQEICMQQAGYLIYENDLHLELFSLVSTFHNKLRKIKKTKYK